MKKIPKSVFIKISPVVLYIEDLEEIEEIYKDNFENYEIIAESKKLENDFEFTSIKELEEDFNKRGIVKLNNLSFEAHDPYIRTEFENIDAMIYSSDNDVKSIGIINKLKNATNKGPKFYKFLNYYSALISVFIFLLIGELLSKMEMDIIINIILWLLYVLWYIWLYNLLMKNYSTIYLKRRNLQKSFLSENKNKIILALIFAFISIIAKVVESNISI